jgi:hypothetical protein
MVTRAFVLRDCTPRKQQQRRLDSAVEQHLQVHGRRSERGVDLHGPGNWGGTLGCLPHPPLTAMACFVKASYCRCAEQFDEPYLSTFSHARDFSRPALEH